MFVLKAIFLIDKTIRKIVLFADSIGVTKKQLLFMNFKGLSRATYNFIINRYGLRRADMIGLKPRV